MEDPALAGSLLQREAELLPLYLAVESASNGLESQHAAAALQKALDAQSFVDEGVRQAVTELLAQPQVMSLLQVCTLSCTSSTVWPTAGLPQSPAMRRGHSC